MPRGNGKGPDGLGPLTGRGLGNCGSLNIVGAIVIIFGLLFVLLGKSNSRK